LNRAVAVAMAEGPERGLQIVDGLVAEPILTATGSSWCSGRPGMPTGSAPPTLPERAPTQCRSGWRVWLSPGRLEVCQKSQ
jgi:hypothetical protein